MDNDPVAGIDNGPCHDFAPDSANPDPADRDVCTTCFYWRADHDTTANTEQSVVVVGDPIDGITIYGPFAHGDDALAYAEQEFRGGPSWWIVGLEPVNTAPPSPVEREHPHEYGYYEEN